MNETLFCDSIVRSICYILFVISLHSSLSHRTVERINISVTLVQQVGPSVAEAPERWLNDGDTSGHEVVYDAGGFSPLQFFRLFRL